MKRSDLEHILRAAGAATQQTDFVLIGSAALFAWRLELPRTMAMSREADIFLNSADPDLTEQVADELDGILGQASQFDDLNGYYCDGVGSESAVMPSDWRDRAIVFSTPAMNGVRALVPSPEDIALSKLVAGRDKDMAWLLAGLKDLIIDADEMRALIPLLPTERVPGGFSALEARMGVLERRLSK